MGDSEIPKIIPLTEPEEKCLCCGPNANLNLLCINPFWNIDNPKSIDMEISIEADENGKSF